MQPFQAAPLVWQSVAAERGFTVPGADGRRRRREVRLGAGRLARNGHARNELVRDGMGLRARGDWLEAVIHAPLGRAAESPCGAPGLWRSLGVGESVARIFEIPAVGWAGTSASLELDDPDVLVEPDESTGVAGRALGALLDWAVATAAGGVPSGWRAPAREEVDSWLASRRLVVRVDAHVAQGELVCETERLAIVFPALVKPTELLNSAREAWLRALCRDTEDRWRLVRVRVDDEGGGVRAEVDLTGVPVQCARPLVQLSLEALACAAEWALPSLALVIDSSVESRALDRHPVLDDPPSRGNAIGATAPRPLEESIDE